MKNQISVTKEELTNQELLRKTIRQVQKDFGQIDTGLEKLLDEEHSFESLVNELSLTVGALLEGHSERLFNIMYKIDLPEKLVKESLETVHPPKALSEWILKRELQKVVIRMRYSG